MQEDHAVAIPASLEGLPAAEPQALRCQKAEFLRQLILRRANLHWTYIGGIERGELNLSLVNIVRIARALEVTPSKLLTGVTCSAPVGNTTPSNQTIH